ncbi:MAG: hypothetical protein BVN32_10995 [Proteobacteria bacterium ST_bin14]|nr:MAG: hypothetical protein BVN32_10995 [Proteobacteria bacterium ST_bin14]
MPDESLHPITTPKGSGAFAILLAVIGVFSPFLTGIVIAQVIAGLAVALILWLYWGEILSYIKGCQGFAGLWLPSASVIAILLVAIYASVGATRTPSLEQSAPALTARDLTAVLSSLNKDREVPPINTDKPQKTDTGRERVTIISGAETTGRQNTRELGNSLTTEDKDFAQVEKTIKIKTLEAKVTNACMREMGGLLGEVAGFYGEGSGIAQNFANNRDSDQIITDFADWQKRVNEFLQQNKSKLPDYSVFELADDTKSPVPPIFKKQGYRAYATLTAKIKALRALSQMIGSKPCDTYGKAAALECADRGNCTFIH